MSEKGDIRSIVKRRVAALSAAQKEAMSASIAERFFALPEYRSAFSVFIYRSMADEPNTLLIIERALADGKRVLLPRIEGEDMLLVPYFAGAETSVNRYGIEEPTGAASNETPDLAVIPLLAFDRDKHRLGRGKGYYDRFLASFKGSSVALAFSAQECDEVPVEPFDMSPQAVVTDREVIR